MINCLHFIEYHPAGKHLPQVGNNFRQSFQLFIRHKQQTINMRFSMILLRGSSHFILPKLSITGGTQNKMFYILVLLQHNI